MKGDTVNVKGFLAHTISTAAGVLTALLIYHYRANIGNAIAHGIPWSSKYIWPLGHDQWVLAILLAVGLVSWICLRHIEEWGSPAMVAVDIVCFMAGFFGTAGGAVFGFLSGHLLFGSLCLAIAITTFGAMVTGEDRPRAVAN